MTDVVDIEVNNRNQYSTGPGGMIVNITDRKVFEQSVGLAISIRYQSIVGGADPNEVVARLRTAARSVAKRDPNIESMPFFEIDASEWGLGSIDVRIIYDTGEVTEFTV